MTVIITSFKESDKILKTFPDIKPFSVSRRQPKGYFYPTIEYLAAYDVNGNRLRLKGREGNPIEGYKKDWKEYVAGNIRWVNDWLNSLDNNDDIMVCCWCPNSQATREQLKNFGTFVCHTGLIAQLIEKVRPDIKLFMDWEHHMYLIPEWKPKNYTIIDY